MRLWDVQQRVCLFQVPVGLPLPSPGEHDREGQCGGRHQLCYVVWRRNVDRPECSQWAETDVAALAAWLLHNPEQPSSYTGYQPWGFHCGVPVILPCLPPGFPAVLEPHVALCAQQQLLALANCAAPAPSSVVKIYSTIPAASSSNSHSIGSHVSSSRTRPVNSTTVAAAAAAAAAVATVGSSSRPDARGALLLRELPVTAAADMKLSQGLLLVASCFHGRAVSNNSPYKSERPFTVVVHVWETRTWQLTRLISPRWVYGAYK